MEQTSPHQHLSTLQAWDTAAMRELASLPRLRAWAFAPQSTFEPEVLGGLANLPKLQVLSFHDSDLSRADLFSLTRLKSLQHLDLKECRFDRADFCLLCKEWARRACPHLVSLSLEATAIGDKELVYIGQVERWQTLVLSHTQISDEGLGELCGLKKLETLWLCDVDVSEEEMLPLAALPRLTNVILSSAHDSERLRIQLFRAQIVFQKSHAPIDVPQLQAAHKQLSGFLAEMERWELDAWTRHGELIGQSLILKVEGFKRAVKALNIEVGAQRAAIVTRYCSRKLQTPVVIYDNLSGLVSNIPQFRASVDWIDAETPTNNKTCFYAEGFVHQVIKRRYALILEDGEWKLDAVQWWWKGGWKRENF